MDTEHSAAKGGCDQDRYKVFSCAPSRSTEDDAFAPRVWRVARMALLEGKEVCKLRGEARAAAVPSKDSLRVLVTELLPLTRFDFLRSSLLSCGRWS